MIKAVYKKSKRVACTLFPFLPAARACVERLHEVPPEAKILGWRTALRLWWLRRVLRGWKSTKLSKMNLKGYEHPLYFRPGSSDPEVIHQVFLRQEYLAVASLSDVKFIVDCGANIGCTSFYLLNRYPNAQVAVVEPDSGNMDVCRKNLAAFGNRVHYFQNGVWSSSGHLVVERGKFRDGAEWSFQVRAARNGEPYDVFAVTLPEIMESAGFPRIDLLKMDIEGAESEVFKTDFSSWLFKTHNLAIELHGEECEHEVKASLANCVYDKSTSGELSIFLNIRRNTIAAN